MNHEKPSKSAENAGLLYLSGADKARIREEMRYASAILAEAKKEKPKSGLELVMGLLSNGFVLLIIGSLITSVLVPTFQRAYEQNKQERALMEECRAEFLRYTNSIWEEFYLLHPLVSETSITKEQYNSYSQKRLEMKLKRYEVYAKLQSVALVFRGDANHESDVEKSLEGYAVEVNQMSQDIDTWLRRLYCYTAGCDNEEIAVDYSSYDAFVEMHDKLDATETMAKEVSELVVKHLKGDL